MNLRLFLLLVVFSCSFSSAQNNPVPLVSQPLFPASAQPGSPAFVLTVTGTGFAPTAVVQWNRSARLTTFISSSKLQASIRTSDVANAGTALVTVVNPAPAGGQSNAVYFPVRLSSPTFQGTQDRNFQPKAHQLAVGDFNNDGKLDVAIANDHTRIDVAFGNGDGTFQSPVSTPTTWRIFNLLAADFNGDGTLDLLAAVNKYQVSIYWGNGDGTFTQGPLSPYAGLGTSFAAADFNGDGKLDFVEGQNEQLGGAEMVVYLNNGDGTFTDSWLNSPAGASLTTLSAVGDFNGDGKLDFANSGYALLGVGNGTFTVSNFCCFDMDVTVATADLNGDGILDVVTDRGAVSLGNGDGTFMQFNDPLYPGINVELADLNGDGKLDVVLRSGPEYGTGKQSMEVMLGNGDGTFQSPIMFKLPPSNGEHQYDQLRLGDFNGDGKIDIIVGANPTFLLLQN